MWICPSASWSLCSCLLSSALNTTVIPSLPKHYFALSFLCHKPSVFFATYRISPNSSGWLSTSFLFPHTAQPTLFLLYAYQLGLFNCSPDTFSFTCMLLCVVFSFPGNPPPPQSFYTFSKAYPSFMKCSAILLTNS